MTIPVYWLCPNAEADARGSWDQGLLEALFAGEAWRAAGGPEFEMRKPELDEGAIVIVPGQHNVQHAMLIGAYIRALPWAITIITSDEESLFPLERIPRGPRHALWVQYHAHDHADRVIPLGPPPGTTRILADAYDHVRAPRLWKWFFAGQTTHERRAELLDVLEHGMQTEGAVRATEGFAQGYGRDAYLRRLAHAELAPAPSGPHSLDSFRLYEALEAGCLPVVETNTPHGEETTFWRALAPSAPIPCVEAWTELEGFRWRWPHDAARAGAWWRGYVRDMACNVRDDVAFLSEAPTPWFRSERDAITVVITTSPTRKPVDDQIAMLEQTIASVRAFPELADVEIIVVADGVRPEQRALGEIYERYLHELVLSAGLRWRNVVPILLGAWGHQANALRRALSEVDTPLVLLMEHDTPFVNEPIPWAQAIETIATEELDMLRFLHESRVIPEHTHLLLDPALVESFSGLRYLRTRQWSQRPHLARTSWYRHLLATYFAPDSRTMVEDVMHGVVDYWVRETGEAGWKMWKVGIFAPLEGTMQRTTHLDGRGSASKFDFLFAYPGEGTPEGAPRATRDRVD